MRGESFWATLQRSTIAAAVLGLVGVPLLARHAGVVWDFVDAFTLAFCFVFVGHYVDLVARGIPGIETVVGRAVRVAAWFAGGLWCYVVARFLWIRFGRDLAELPPLAWGGVFFVAWQLAGHAVLRARGRPNFYMGDA